MGVSFYPGPSRVYDGVGRWAAQAQRDGILSMNHRSRGFTELCEKTQKLFRKKLKLPADYTLYFLTSATECWEVIAQSLVLERSLHLFNGAFGEKWYTYTKALCASSYAVSFNKDQIPPLHELGAETDAVCITHNETSNGTWLPPKVIASIRSHVPHALLAADATSGMAGVTIDFRQADVWFASVQKCFGLPAGLAVMVCSPRAVERMRKKGENKHYNSMSLLHQMMEKFQTPCTPNVLGIYLLYRALEHIEGIATIHRQTMRRHREWTQVISNFTQLQWLCPIKELRSPTVIALQGETDQIEAIKKAAAEKGFLLGDGYGSWKPTTFRIANFPALKESEIKGLQKFLLRYEER